MEKQNLILSFIFLFWSWSIVASAQLRQSNQDSNVLTASDTANTFQRKLWTSANGFNLDYYTFLPASIKPSAGYPLILALHGTEDMIDLSGEGSHLINRETVKGWTESNIQTTYKPYILAPQVSLSASWNDQNVQDAIDDIIQGLISSNIIDSNRIYIVGHSAGGGAAWLYPVNLDTKFAAIAPMSGFWFDIEADLTLAEAAQQIFPDVSIWNFHHYRDPGSGVLDSRNIINILQANGITFTRNSSPATSNLVNKYIYTEYTDSSLPCSGISCHQICNVAIKNVLFIQWLFSQELGTNPPPVTEYYQLKNKSSGGDFKSEGDSIFEVYSSINDFILWEKIITNDGYIRLKNKGSGLYITAANSGSNVFGAASADNDYSKWQQVNISNDSHGFYYLLNRGSGKKLHFYSTTTEHKLDQVSSSTTNNTVRFKLVQYSAGGSLLANNKLSEQLLLYPNPVSNNALNVNGITSDKGKLIVTDLFGAEVACVFKNGLVDISGVKPGLYIVKVFDGDKLISQQRLIVEK